MRIDDREPGNRSDMQPRSSAPGVGVEHEPLLALDMSLEHEHVPAPGRRHVRGRLCSRKPQPVRREVQRRDDLAEQVERGTAAAEKPGATSWPTTDDSARFPPHALPEGYGRLDSVGLAGERTRPGYRDMP